MTAALVAVSLAGLGLGAALSGVIFYLTRGLSKVQDRYAATFTSLLNETKASLDWQRQVIKWKQAHEDVSKILGEKENELRAEIASRKLAEGQRDRFLAEAAKGGDVKAIATAVNKELGALAGLGRKPE